MDVSMSGVGQCWDNAAMESFWATLKTELVHHEQYRTREAGAGVDLRVRRGVLQSKAAAQFVRLRQPRAVRGEPELVTRRAHRSWGSPNYFSEVKSKVPLRFVLALLNSKLADWYFRLGSTNAAVSHYQLHNLPCPKFVGADQDAAPTFRAKAMLALKANRLDEVMSVLAPLLDVSPFVPVIQDVLVEAADTIMKIETTRGVISRSDRSALSEKAQPYQDLIDCLFYRMAGLTNAEAGGLESRLSEML